MIISPFLVGIRNNQEGGFHTVVNHTTTMKAAPPRFLGILYDAYSDNDIDKEVFLQAAGLSYSDRHVLIWWSNACTPVPTGHAAQAIQLTGQAGNYSYYAPVALSTTVTQNLQISLGLFA